MRPCIEGEPFAARSKCTGYAKPRQARMVLLLFDFIETEELK